MPDVNIAGFMPNFGLADGIKMPEVRMPNFSMGNSFSGGGWNVFGSFFGGSSIGSPSRFSDFAPAFGGLRMPQQKYFEWSNGKLLQPPTFPGGTSGGIGSADGNFSALNQYDAAFIQAAAAHGGGVFDANWLKALAMMEGGWGAGAVSGAGAIGIMQIIPGGYPELQKLYPNWRTDPTQNIMLGAAILASKIRENGGSRDMGTQRYLGVGTDPYTGVTTEQYLANIKNYYGQLQKTTTGSAPAGSWNGQAGSSYLSVFKGVSYPISSENGKLNGAPPSWYYAIDDELGLPVGSHAGLDVSMPDGTPIYMPSGVTGVVERATGEYGYGYDTNGGVARSGPGTGELRIRLSNGNMILMGHMQKIYLPVGSTVNGGQLLGLTGAAGSGAHVHFEYRIPGNTSSGWVSVDPRQYLR